VEKIEESRYLDISETLEYRKNLEESARIAEIVCFWQLR